MINHFQTLLCNLGGGGTPDGLYEFLREDHPAIEIGSLSRVYAAFFGSDPDALGVRIQAYRLVQVVRASPELRSALSFHDPRIVPVVPPAGRIDAVTTTGVNLQVTGHTSDEISGRAERTFVVSPVSGGHRIEETRTGQSVSGSGPLRLPVTMEIVTVSGSGRFSTRRMPWTSLGRALTALGSMDLSDLWHGEDSSLREIFGRHYFSHVRIGAAACAFVSKMHRLRGL